MSETINEFETDNLGIAAYADAMGLDYVGTKLGRGKRGKPNVVFVFEDPDKIGQRLEKDYIFSEQKKFRDLIYFFRNEIDKIITAANMQGNKFGRR